MTHTDRPCHIITLKRREDRRREFLRLNQGKADFVFVEAVDGADLSREAMESDGLLAPRTQYVTQGALGCALSHRQLWEQCLDEAEPTYIFEDDACLAPGFMAQAAAALDQAGDVDILYFGYNLDQSLALYLAGDLVAMMKVSDSVVRGDGWLDRFAGSGGIAPGSVAVMRPLLLWGLLAYAITPSGAAKLLSQGFPLRNHDLSLPGGKGMSRGIDGSVLALIQQGAVKAACCFPPIVIGPNLDSDTEGGRKKPGDGP